MNFIMELLGYYSCTGTKVSSAVRNAKFNTCENGKPSHLVSADGQAEFVHFVPIPQIPHDSSPRDLCRHAYDISESLCKPWGRMPEKETMGKGFVVQMLNAK